MAKLPENFQESQTVLAIYDAYEKAATPRFSRRLGASVIGQECARAVWYGFRWATQEKFDGRKLRLFETGNLSESRFAANLQAIGCEIHLLDPDTKKQIEHTAIAGHVVVKLDGMALGVPEAEKSWHVTEFKTHNNKSFNELRAKGLKNAKPQHYAQLILGMKLADVPRGLYLAVNKDTDELYSERLRIEDVKEAADDLLEFAETIIKSNRAPEKISDKSDSIPCRWCTFKNICHGGDAAALAVPACITCRSCCHSSPVMEGDWGAWRCERHGKTISEPEQIAACEDHLFIPDFVSFAAPTDGGETADGVGFVEYTNSAGQKWKNGRADGHYRSIELAQMPQSLIATDEFIDAAKKELGGVVVPDIPTSNTSAPATGMKSDYKPRRSMVPASVAPLMASKSITGTTELFGTKK